MLNIINSIYMSQFLYILRLKIKNMDLNKEKYIVEFYLPLN